VIIVHTFFILADNFKLAFFSNISFGPKIGYLLKAKKEDVDNKEVFKALLDYYNPESYCF